MLSFYFFAGYVENEFNLITGNELGILFVVFYISALVMSGMYDYYRHQNNYAYSALGASGAVAAVIFAYIVLCHQNSRLAFWNLVPFLRILYG